MSRLQATALAIGLVGSVSAQVLGGAGGASVATSATVPATVSTSATASTSPTTSGSATSAAQPGTASVVSIYFPGADQLPYVASLIGQSGDAQTLAISCGPGVNSDTCGFPSSVTVTAGPSTAYVSVSNPEATFIYDCKITGLTSAICAETFNGDAAYIATATGQGAVSGSTSSVITETLASSDITWMPITITDFGNGAKPTGSSATSAPYPDGGAAWSAASMGSQPPASNSIGSQPAGSKTGVWPALWTGAATRVSMYGNYAAGLVAVAGLML